MNETIQIISNYFSKGKDAITNQSLPLLASEARKNSDIKTQAKKTELLFPSHLASTKSISEIEFPECEFVLYFKMRLYFNFIQF